MEQNGFCVGLKGQAMTPFELNTINNGTDQSYPMIVFGY